MKILIAVRSKEYSSPTLDVGMNISRYLRASTTIVDVGEKVSEISSKDIKLANEIMDSWDLDRPGIDVLEWAYDYLVENKFIDQQDEGEVFPKNLLVHHGERRAELLLKGSVVKNLRLILRNGDIVDELRDEVQTYQYDVTIIGDSGRRKMVLEIVRYIDSSIFLINNFTPKKIYKILLAVDDSPGTRKALRYGVRIAKAFGIDVTLLTISKNKKFGEVQKKASKHAETMMRRSGISAKIIMETGDPVKTIIKTAGQDHIIIMGESRRSPLKKLFLGSKPLNVMKLSQTPVLIVK